MSVGVALAAALVVAVVLLALYILHNDAKLTALPPECVAASPHRWADADILGAHARMRAAAATDADADAGRALLPPRTGRRYIVVGGAGFLGGWIVVQLLRRGEDPRRIRVLDIRRPTRKDLLTGPAKGVDYRICDVADEGEVRRAFTDKWPAVDDEDAEKEPELTVFHAAASIRFYERAWSLVPLSAAVNVKGAENVVRAACAAGASVLVATSSGSTRVRRARFWLWPWERSPPFFVQRIGDAEDDNDEAKDAPRRHNEFFSNYAYTKRLGEEIVRAADGCGAAKGRTLRTGVLRPGNGIYGPGGDVLCGAALVRGTNPTWIANTMQNFVYVENAAMAHLCFEARLIPTTTTTTTAHGVGEGPDPDVGGNAFCIADAGPPPTYGDVYRALHVLSGGRATFPPLSPTLALLLATLVEPIHILRLSLAATSPSSPPLLRTLARWCIPSLPGDLLNLQPSLFALVGVHMLFDDSRARKPAHEGGMGYRPGWTTLEGLCALVDAFERDGRVAEPRQAAGGVGLKFGLGLGLRRGFGRVFGRGLARKLGRRGFGLTHALGALWRPGREDVGTPTPRALPEPAKSDGGVDVDVDVNADVVGAGGGMRKRAS